METKHIALSIKYLDSLLCELYELIESDSISLSDKMFLTKATMGIEFEILELYNKFDHIGQSFAYTSSDSMDIEKIRSNFIERHKDGRLWA
jgi:hypothetical protein